MSRSSLNRIRCIWLILAVLGSGLFVRPAEAADPGRFALSAFSLEYRDSTLLISLGIGFQNEEALRIMLKDGAQMELSGEIRLVRPRGLLPNVLVAERGFSFILRHDTLTRDFELHLPAVSGSSQEGVSPVFRNKQLDILLQSTVQRLLIPVASISKLAEDQSYRLDLALSLRHTDVPPWLSRTLFFWSWDVVPPAKYAKAFTYEGRQ